MKGCGSLNIEPEFPFLIAQNVNLIAVDKLKRTIDITVKTRYRQIEKKAKLIPLDGGEFKVEFEEPERAVAEGQAAVFAPRHAGKDGRFVYAEAGTAFAQFGRRGGFHTRHHRAVAFGRIQPGQ